MEEKQKPAHEIRLGRIRAAIWANPSDRGQVWFNVTVSRLYKDGDRWLQTTSYRRDDLPLVSRVVNVAYAWIWEQETHSDSGPVGK
jgi:hypothetical protein